ncbi:MAG: serine/threonine protein kinase [Myxococcota bacterium]|nr:serine/threonine protein kinase [Myxococcota bacterium]
MDFDSLQDEVQFLRALVRMTRLVDEILEDCLEQQLGLAAALDVFLAQAVRLVPSRGGFVQLCGSRGPVLCRATTHFPADFEALAASVGAVPFLGGNVYVRPLTLGKTRVGAFGLWIPGALQDAKVLALVDAMAEQLDSSLLGFMALAEGHSPLERLDELNDALHFLPKARIGRYELVAPLAAGGMAQVMVARTLGPEGVGRLVALKRILPHLCSDATMIEQFLDEARIGMRLSHPNLVVVHDFGQTGGSYFIAMELVRGVDLFDLLERVGPLEPATAVGILVQALTGLQAAHQARAEDGSSLELVHRDLSPSNVMIGYDGRVKVMDFGVAQSRVHRSVTQAGLVKGKPQYMAPEQAVADPLDHRTDLFAMGLILVEALTGHNPFRREDDVKTMEAIVNESLTLPAGIPAALRPVVERALAKNPADRFANAAQMAIALERAVVARRPEALGRELLTHFPERLRTVTGWERHGSSRDVSLEHTRERAAVPK